MHKNKSVQPTSCTVPYQGKGTALHHAATYGHADVVAMLLEKGASPNAADNRGDRPGEKFDHEVGTSRFMESR